jgi:hypothetical protein
VIEIQYDLIAQPLLVIWRHEKKIELCSGILSREIKFYWLLNLVALRG